MEKLNRSRLLLGDDAMQKLHDAKIIIFGVGGVGSWCAESLIRSGAGNLTIVDGDRVCASNINRQLMATVKTIGEIKVDALKRHLLEVNPEASIDARHAVFCEETAPGFHLENYDIIIDCIDSLKDKALLIQLATLTDARFFSSMGAALKLDPTRIEVAEFRKVKGCPLARALRNRFKREKRFPAKKFLCVYGEEVLKNHEECRIEAKANGSLHHITAIFGMTIAGLAIKSLVKD